MSSTARASMALTVAAILCVSGSLTAGITSYAKSQRLPRTTQLAGPAGCDDRLWLYVQADCAPVVKPVAVAVIVPPVVVSEPDSGPPAPAMELAAVSVAAPVPPLPMPEAAAIVPAAEAPRIEAAPSRPAETEPAKAEVAKAEGPRPEPSRTDVQTVEAPKVEAATRAPADAPRPVRTARIYEPITAPRSVESVKALDAPLGESVDGPPRVVRVIQIDRVPVTAAGRPFVPAASDAGLQAPSAPAAVAAPSPASNVIVSWGRETATAPAAPLVVPVPIASQPGQDAGPAVADAVRASGSGQRARRQVAARDEAVDDEPRTRSRRYGRRSSYRSYRYRRYGRGEDYGRRRRYVDRSEGADEVRPGAPPAQPGAFAPQSGQRVIYRRPAAGGILGWLGGTSEN